MSLLSSISICSLLVTVIAQAPADPVKDFCRIYGHQTAVIDRKLFVDGGWRYANPIPQNPQPTINQGLYYGDLDKLNEYNFPTVFTNVTKNASVPDVSGGVLWADQVNKVFWLYGGEYASSPSAFQLWGYDILLNQWNLSKTASGTASNVKRVSYGAGTTVSELGKGYYYGGYLNNLTNPQWTGPPLATNNLIVFDMDSNTLTNKTGAADGVGRAEGTMVSIPASASGMLVYFGGVTYPYHNTTPVPQPMDSIMLYDISDEKWYVQTATGDVPANRRKFCGGATWAPDKSSYNIYIYGGFGFGENSTGFDDVYILSMPSFQWIKWYPEPGAALNPHGVLSCNVIENAQMIIMGGNFTQHTNCDVSNVMGMHNLILGQNGPANAKWNTFQPDLKNYVVPSAIVSAVGGSATGSATKILPASGWSDPGLQVYFSEQAQYQARTPTRSIVAPTGRSDFKGDEHSAPIGAIVGAVVGGAVALIVAILILALYRRRSKKALSNRQSHNSPQFTGPSELSGMGVSNEKAQSVVQTTGMPGSPQSLGSSPMSTLPPSYQYQSMYSTHDATNQQNHMHLSPSPQQYPYPYAQPNGPVQLHADSVSPPTGWAPHPPQQYFPPPESQRISTIAQEMPATKTPGPDAMPSTRSGEDERLVYYPTPIRYESSAIPTSPVRRREVGSLSGGASSPSTVVTTSVATHNTESGHS